MKLSGTFIFAALFPLAFSLHAQSQSSQEHHRRFNPQHPGHERNRVTTPQQHRPTEVWENKYGALAYDAPTSSVWASEDQPSLRAARRDALKKCGRKTCEIVTSVVNSCIAAGDNSQRTYFGSGDTQALAIQDVHNLCAADGATCTIGYVHCNVPVRIR